MLVLALHVWKRILNLIASSYRTRNVEIWKLVEILTNPRNLQLTRSWRFFAQKISADALLALQEDDRYATACQHEMNLQQPPLHMLALHKVKTTMSERQLHENKEYWF